MRKKKHTTNKNKKNDNKKLLSNIEQKPMDGGHFFPDQYPQETVSALASFICNNID